MREPCREPFREPLQEPWSGRAVIPPVRRMQGCGQGANVVICIGAWGGIELIRAKTRTIGEDLEPVGASNGGIE